MMTVDKYAVIEQPLYGYRKHQKSTMFSNRIIDYYMHSFDMQCMVSKELTRRKMLDAYKYEFQILHFSKAFVEEINRMIKDPDFESYDNFCSMVSALFELFPDFMSNPYLSQESLSSYVEMLKIDNETDFKNKLHLSRTK
ncbi:MAG: hypothetical protein K6E98_01235 [Lachnospiraceae bacterium]|nr:hypothetical protein [Lachnospiraceae bacterium]